VTYSVRKSRIVSFGHGTLFFSLFFCFFGFPLVHPHVTLVGVFRLSRIPSMRKKRAVGVGLVAVVLAIVGPPFVAVSFLSPQPPLPVGMEPEEVHKLLGKPGHVMLHRFARTEWYTVEINILVYQQEVWVWYDCDDRVKGWKTKRVLRTRPSWLNRAMKEVGW
jgi:hypothetical protein